MSWLEPPFNLQQFCFCLVNPGHFVIFIQRKQFVHKWYISENLMTFAAYYASMARGSTVMLRTWQKISRMFEEKLQYHDFCRMNLAVDKPSPLSTLLSPPLIVILPPVQEWHKLLFYRKLIPWLIIRVKNLEILGEIPCCGWVVGEDIVKPGNEGFINCVFIEVCYLVNRVLARSLTWIKLRFKPELNYVLNQSFAAVYV